jgi:tetratricopeptide (TPR) repeat protein
MRRTVAAIVVLALAIAARPVAFDTCRNAEALPRGTGGSRPNGLIARAYDSMYSLDYPEALKTFEEAIAAQPKDPTAYRGIATLTLLYILYQRGVFTVDDHVRNMTKGGSRPPAPPAEAERFRTSIDRSLALAEDALRRNPKSAVAHYDVGAAVGLQASYTGSVEGSFRGALGSARRAYSEQEEVLEIDPGRKDAGLVVGTYRYIVANLPFYLRFMAYVVGFGGGKERGIQMIEEAAAYPGDTQIESKFALVLLYNREKRYDAALKVIRDLQQRFPRNRFLWLEAGATALRAGRAAEAEAELNAGFEHLRRDTRPRAPGEEALWRYKRGAARLLLGDAAGAEADSTASLGDKGHEWVTARAHLDLGKLADLAGNRARAQDEYRTAATIARQVDESETEDEANALIGTAYRRR